MKAYKYLIAVVLLAFMGYNSVYFRKLDAHKATQSANEFSAANYAGEFWNTKLIPNLNKAIELPRLLELLTRDPVKTFDDYSHALGIGNLRYFLVNGKGVVESVQPDDVTVILPSGEQRIVLATEFIFGNAVRDATGLVNINEFSNTMDFNNVSAEINKMIREKVLPPFKQKVKAGHVVEFTGAVELNKEHLNMKNLEVIPIQITIVQ
jgi:predicted lipoprotein